MRKWLSPLLLALSVTGRTDERWFRVESPHFEVLTNAGPGTAREVARRFEQIRHAFETRTGQSSLTPLPVRVFVFRNETEFQPYQISRNSVGYYQAGYDRDYIAMQSTGADTYRVVYHEYTHLLLRHAGYRVPVWFNEGTAEMFSTADVGNTEVRIGDLIPAHVMTLRNERMLDILTLTTVDQGSPHYNERGKSGIFYAQSWALTHMLNFAPEYRAGLANFLEMILDGEDAVRSFQRAFGKSPAAVLQDLKAYVQGARFEGVRFRAAKLNVGKFPVEALGEVKGELGLADLLLAIGKLDETRSLFGKLEASHRSDPAVLAALGQFAFRTEDFVGARRFLESSIEAGGADARVYYNYAMALRELKQPQALVMQNLLRAIQLDNACFDAHQYAGYLYLRDEKYAEAIYHLTRSTELQPNRAALWENLALAYHKAGDKRRAMHAARAGRKVASGPEEAARLDALVDLIESDADKIVEAPLSSKRDVPNASPGPGRMEGTLIQVDCLGKKARLHVATAKAKTLLLVRDPMRVALRGAGGLTTELMCGPIAARPVIVEYGPEQNGTYGTAGIVFSVEFR